MTEAPVTLLTPKTAPKDGHLIIGDFEGEAFPLPAFWNPAKEEWVIARPKLKPYKESYIFTEFESVRPKGALCGWLPVPCREDQYAYPDE